MFSKRHLQSYFAQARSHTFTNVLSLMMVSLVGSASAQEVQDVIWGTYAIQSVQNNKNIRPYAARKDDGNPIVLYDSWRWKCMTWQFVRVSDNTYRLINRYTGKAFEAASNLVPGVELIQQISGNTPAQEWVFFKQSDGTWIIQLKDSDLYVTASSADKNAPVILMPKQDSITQRWRLFAQDPWF